uniref:Peptidase C1A papain C-terminal domain-containing protein n=1 Tax=Panagrolaimus sp. ES5 TaxID=591445 RepID=A0AC34GQW5_9BILA
MNIFYCFAVIIVLFLERCRSECTEERCDWRDEGAVTAAKDQTDCNVCWAFAAAAVGETFYKRNTGKPIQILSEQFLMDCGHIYKKRLGRCVRHEGKVEGGDISEAFNVIKKIGLPNITTYGWAGRDKECPNIPEKDKYMWDLKFYARSYRDVSVDALKGYVRNNGLVAVLINPTPEWSKFKGGGIFSEPCDGTIEENLIHAVAIIG